MTRIAVLITCHNRREKTLCCLRALYASALEADVTIDTYLVDDGSTDQTRDHVAAEFPQVRLILGTGHLYWNRGMHLAVSKALESDFDYHLWLNDDVVLYADTIRNMLYAEQQESRSNEREVVVVGSMQDKLGGPATYGGLISESRRMRLKFYVADPLNSCLYASTVNGNCVLFPENIVRTVGNLNPDFQHSMGDIDYGFRVRSAGFFIRILPGFAGLCAHNSISNSFQDLSLNRFLRFRKIIGVKGLPIAQWFSLTRRYSGIMWPFFFIWPYIACLLSGNTVSVKKMLNKMQN